MFRLLRFNVLPIYVVLFFSFYVFHFFVLFNIFYASYFVSDRFTSFNQLCLLAV